MPNDQSPLGSGFGPASTAAQVIDGIDLTGTTAIVTGGYSGIGLETVRVLRAAGAAVVVPGRDRDKAETALAGIDGVEIAAMELAEPDSIAGFVDQFVASERPLHLLVNNAGIMAVPLRRDSRGFESQFAINHLGHFQLTVGLWPALVRAHGALCVVNVSSWGHRYSDIVWDDPHFEQRDYNPLGAYGQSKTANNLTAAEIARRGRDHRISAFSLHPGSIITGLSRHTPIELLQQIGVVDENGQPIIDPSRNLKTVEQGAATTVWCATSPQLDGRGGLYCENCDVAPTVPEATESGTVAIDNRRITAGDSKPNGVMPYSVDPDAARRLWTLSAELVGCDIL